MATGSLIESVKFACSLDSHSQPSWSPDNMETMCWCPSDNHSWAPGLQLGDSCSFRHLAIATWKSQAKSSQPMVEVVGGLPSVWDALGLIPHITFYKKPHTTSMVAYAFNLSSWEAGTSQLWEF